LRDITEHKELEKYREDIAHIVCGNVECYGTCPSYKGKEYPCQSDRPDRILDLVTSIWKGREIDG